MKFLLLTIFTLLLAAPAFAQKEKSGDPHEHNYGPLREATIEVKDFTYPTSRGDSIQLREAIKGKKLVILHFFAAWCHNSNYDVKTMSEIYNRYKDRGVLVLGVCEYSKNDEIRAFLEKHNPPYPVSIEGGKKLDRAATTHYAYRKLASDDRAWGTPLNILFKTEDVNSEGEIIVSRVRIALGEAVKSELEDWIESSLPKK